MTPPDVILRNVWPWGGDAADITICHRRIAEIRPVVETGSARGGALPAPRWPGGGCWPYPGW